MSEAVVLNAYPNGDTDSRVSLLTKRFGKLVAKVKSAKKITSKLAGHLQPGDLSRVRLVEKGGLQAADALKISRLNASLLDLYLLDRMLHEAEPDPELWQVVTGKWDWSRILRILGWDPVEAVCSTCGNKPEYFYPENQDFFCRQCALMRDLKLKPDEVISLT